MAHERHVLPSTDLLPPRAAKYPASEPFALVQVVQSFQVQFDLIGSYLYLILTKFPFFQDKGNTGLVYDPFLPKALSATGNPAVGNLAE